MSVACARLDSGDPITQSFGLGRRSGFGHESAGKQVTRLEAASTLSNRTRLRPADFVVASSRLNKKDHLARVRKMVRVVVIVPFMAQFVRPSSSQL